MVILPCHLVWPLDRTGSELSGLDPLAPSGPHCPCPCQTDLTDDYWRSSTFNLINAVDTGKYYQKALPRGTSSMIAVG